MHQQQTVKGKNLLITLILNFLITAVQLVGGIVSGSLALLSDALHNFSDGIAVGISYLAFRISQRQATPRNTFGFKRAEILAALLNGAVLVILSFFLFREAIQRLFAPVTVKPGIMGLAGLVGLAANFAAVILLKGDAGRNLNFRSAYLHLLSDAFSSLAVVLGSLLIYFFDILWLDSLLTLLIGLYVLKHSYRIIRETVEILMQAAPAGLNLSDLQEFVEGLDGVENLHHLHVWRLNDREIHLEAHLNLTVDHHLSDCPAVTDRISRLLLERFGISHSTLQVEFEGCRGRDEKCS